MRRAISAVFSLLSVTSAQLRCGTQAPTNEQLQVSAQMAVEALRSPKSFRTAENIIVPTYFHVLSNGSSVSQGNIPDSVLLEQLNVLNEDYASTGFQFSLLGTSRTINSDWYNEKDKMSMKQTLRQGDYKTLNIYFQNLSREALGYCEFPMDRNNSTILKDGCHILSTSLPGGSMINYNGGRTATHEIGHWFGLYHTFQGGCSGLGDFVLDTPAQGNMTTGCPESKDTCPDIPGVDPIHNFMDYSYDACMKEFTPGQATRMYQQYQKYRNDS